MLLAVAAVLAAIAYRAVASFPSMLVEDDAWFYLKIGYELATQGQSTFDGIHATSGYHLAWTGLLALLAAGASALGSGKALYLLASLTAYLFLGLLLADRLGRSRAEKLALLVLVFLSSWLMEGLLLATIVLLLIQQFLGPEQPGAEPGWSTLALAAAMPLVRIDAVLILLPLGLMPLAAGRRAAALRFYVAAVVGVVLQLGIMWVAFGHLASVSSLVKAQLASELGVVAMVARNLPGYAGFKLAVAVVLTLLAVWAVFDNRRAIRPQAALLALAGPVTFTLAHVLLNPDLREWYLEPLIFSASAVVIFAGARWPRAALLALVVLLAAREVRSAWLFYADDAAQQRTARIELFLAEVRETVPPEAPIFMVDGSGYPGFFSGRHIVNGDGLMNSYAYYARWRDRDLAGYLRQNDIRYLMTNDPIEGSKILDYRGLVVQRDQVDLVASAELTHRFQSYRLWRLRADFGGATPDRECINPTASR